MVDEAALRTGFRVEVASTESPDAAAGTNPGELVDGLLSGVTVLLTLSTRRCGKEASTRFLERTSNVSKAATATTTAAVAQARGMTVFRIVDGGVARRNGC